MHSPSRRHLLLTSTAGLAALALPTAASRPAHAATPAARPVDLFLNMGQSNAGGDNAANLTSAYRYLTSPIPAVRQTTASAAFGAWHPYELRKITFGDAAVHRLHHHCPAYSRGERDLALFKFSVGSTSTADWKRTHMRTAITRLQAAIAALHADPTVSGVRVVDMVWVQGEQDVIDGDAYRYGSRFRYLHNMVRGGVPEAKNMHATVVHLNPGWSRYTSSPERRRETALFNREVTTIGKMAIINDLWVPNAKDRGDGTHYDTDSFARGGIALADMWKKHHRL